MSRTVRSVSLFALTAALAASAASIPAEGRSGARAPRTRTVRAELTPPRGSTHDRARGRIVARRTGADGSRETLALELTGLARGARYTIACDDPSRDGTAPEPVAEVRTRRSRTGRAVLGTGRRAALPYESSLDDLAGTRIEVRDDRGLLVLSGQVPSLDGATGSAPPANCRFLEEVVLEDTFDAGTVGEAPADWEVSGTDVTGIEVAVDDSVFEGASGASVRLADGVAADPGAPVLARSFTAQDGHFAVEFTLFTGDADGRAVLRVADSSTDPDTFATGLGDGLGLYEDGSIGFAADDPIRAASASTGYRIRVDFDVAAQTFDVTIDGETLVEDRDLGFTGTSLDRLEFSGATTTTGTAWIDTVRVIEKTLDCAPTANAGTDQVLECAGRTTAVTLDGSLSADPEGATLTYTWTGDFVEGTATGATPTVHFAGHGPHEVILVVNDGFFDSDPDTVAIEIVDTTPPELSVTGLPTEIWPPNHKMVRVTPRVVATDLCDGDDVHVTLVITSNEADDGLGDGTTTGDWTIRSPSDFDLRAERSGTGSGRVYSLVWTATDSSGNSTQVAARVGVPHDQGHGGDDGDDDGDDDGHHGNGNHGHGNSGHGNPGRGRGPK